jgi:cyclic-di-AMP phosphodiesterase PgpH
MSKRHGNRSGTGSLTRDPRDRRGTPGPSPRVIIINILLGIIFVAGSLSLFPPYTPSPSFDYHVGDVTQTGEEVIAPISFMVPVAPKLLEEQRAAASIGEPPIYRFDPTISEQMNNRLDKLSRDLMAIQAYDSLETLVQRTERLLGLNPFLNRDDARVLLEHGPDLLEQVGVVVDTLLAGGILDTRRPLTGRGVAGNRMILIRPDGEVFLDGTDVEDQEDLGHPLERQTRKLNGWSQEARLAVQSLARAHLLPNYFYDSAETSLRKREAAESVAEYTIVAKGVRILGPNVQVTQGHLDKLAALEEAQGLQRLTPMKTVILYAGRTLLIGFLMGLMVSFLRLYRRNFLWENRRILLLMILMLGFLSASKYILQLETSGTYLLPITFVAMILAGLYDSVLAIVGTVFSLIVLAVLASPPAEGLVVALLAGGTSIFSIKQIRNRLQLYKSIAYVALAYLLGITAIHLSAGEFSGIFINLVKGAGNGVICSWLVMPILPLLERFFDLTTDFTLLELTDLNRPLLKRMKVEAPGTFQHSLVVSNLAESAADEIGANPLLAKVGAYYHDVGKLLKPEYFGENTLGGRNRHEKLSPNMSALIIGAHVKEGLELAEKIKLPSIVRQAIPEHHGTTVMKYFYHKAVEKDPHGKVKRDDFRYPGPRPRSAETAIIMLADTVEATVRSLKQPSSSSIRTVVREALEERLKDGELEECGLSLRDLAQIRESFITSLLSIHHPRIQYPSDKKPGDEEPAAGGETTPRPAPDDQTGKGSDEPASGGESPTDGGSVKSAPDRKGGSPVSGGL